MIRFLRDADLLQSVTDITSVSGGSVIAAHLCLNWDRYNGSPSEFDAAADELLSFVRLDVRNRIVRRYPFGFAAQLPRRLAGLSNRKLTRAGLLETHYENYLYGDTSVFQLPEQPHLHILATNLSEGCLCSFNRDGLWMIRRERGHSFKIDRFLIGLATVPMAVAASSAFPGFFPPLELTGAAVGARSGEFGRQSYTDGGVFDNLGVRLFRFLAKSSAADERAWDAVLVSDVGKPFEIRSNLRAGGLIRTAVRASDILMDRVWQLETETFKDAPGFVFARITDFVDPDQDPTALHLEIQRQLPSIRTDFDRFSDVEISNLVQQGYTVGRKVCRQHPEVFGTELPTGAPWDPIVEPTAGTSAGTKAAQLIGSRREATEVTKVARTLHASAVRRIWSTLLDYRDWVSYIYVPIIIPILILLPYFVARSYERSRRLGQIVESLAQGSRDLEQMTRLMEGTVTPWAPAKNFEELPADDKADLTGYLILQDLRIIDLRKWLPSAEGNDNDSHVYGYRRLKVQKGEDANSNDFRVSVLAFSPETQVRFPVQQLDPKLYSRGSESLVRGEKRVRWEIGANFEKVPVGEYVDIIYEHWSPGLFLRKGSGSTGLAFEVEAETAELTRWLLLPEGKEYQTFNLVRYPTGKPEASENVQLVTKYLADDFSILAFKLLALKAGYTYELTWYYR
jgi:predicted acylesterase/phospholipase RssA